MSLLPAFEVGVWNAWIFMVVFIVYLILILLIFKKDVAGKKLAYRGEGKKINTFLLPVIILLTIYSIFLPLIRGTAWFYVGSVVFLLGLFIIALTVSTAADTQVGEPFTKGVYRYSRHPLYISFYLIFLGAGTASASWLFILLAVILIFLSRPVMIIEESLTAEKFGDSYREYINRTPRWLGMPKSGKD